MQYNQSFTLGIDIGGTTIKCGLVDENATIHHYHTFNTNEFNEVRNFIEAVYQYYNPLLATLNKDICGIGIGVPNGNWYSGCIEYAPNLPWKGVVPLTKLFQDYFNVSSKLTNDVKAALIGELLFGAAQNHKNAAVVSIGTGVGSGIICNGYLVMGHDGLAGELGHIPIIPNGRAHPSTGLLGTVEAYCGAGGIIQTAKEFCVQFPESELNFVDYYTPEIIYSIAKKGDACANEVFNFTADVLAKALATLVMITSPALIVINGGIANADIFFNALTEKTNTYLLPVFKNKVEIVKSAFSGAQAPIIGAAALLRRDVSKIIPD